MTGGSQQQRAYRRYRFDGLETEQAASLAGISLGEARLIDQEDARNPPPAEAMEPINHGPAPAGHNSKEADLSDVRTSIAADELRMFVERWERLEEEKKGIADDQKDIMAEMKGRGYDTAIVRKVINIRKLEPGKWEEQNSILETYLAALGMI